MKITQDEIVDRQTVVHIELEDDDLDPYLDRGYRRVVQRVQIPGFRKGKAPRRIVQQFLGSESLLNEVLDTMLPELTSRAIEEQELDVAGLPQMEMVGLEPF
ncbi:MAG: trigger factor family protein, partial [SAR202 cluster bacterium]|nr:trigger factor family protein [SAR202 cluster bacterium]